MRESGQKEYILITPEIGVVSLKVYVWSRIVFVFVLFSFVCLLVGWLVSLFLTSFFFLLFFIYFYIVLNFLGILFNVALLTWNYFYRLTSGLVHILNSETIDGFAPNKRKMFPV